MVSAPPQVFHSRVNRPLAVFLWVVAAAIAVAAAWPVDAQSWRSQPLAVLLAFFAWAALWRPSIVVTDEGVELRNVTHTAKVPWDAIIQVRTQYSLALQTPHRAYRAWVAPAPGRPARRALSARRGPDDAATTPASAAPTADSGSAAALITDKWTELLDRDRVAIGAADRAVVERTVHVGVLVTLAALFAAFIAAVAW